MLTALKGLGYEEPTPIQRETIPALIDGRDVLGQAATGTGKTAAFALPILERVTQADRKPFEAQALVLVPTRELAMQVTEALQKYGAGIGVTAVAVYGGQEFVTQLKPLKRGADVVVATPGRALDHIRRKTLLLNKVKLVVLDEADEMLDMGFEEDLQSILGELPDTRQTALFSATLAPRIAKIAEKHLKDPVRVTIAAKSVAAGTLPNIRQAAYIVQRKVKEAALMRVLEWENPASAIIFCRTRNEVEELTHSLMRSGYDPAALHGGLTQEQRDAVLRKFKEGDVRVLVATDVAARGLHVENLSHVINFDLPTSPEVYVHRIGRTGRAGKDGVALSFLDPRESRLLGNVERQMKKKIQILQVPTKAQLDAKRAETVADQVKAAISAPGVNAFNELVAKAGEGATVEQGAGAGMTPLQQKLFPSNASDTADFPTGNDRRPSSGPRDRPERGDRPDRGDRRERSGGREDRPQRSAPRGPMTTLTLSLGEAAGIRPQDLVGAIANEANISSSLIARVQIGELQSTVDVPSESVQAITDALHATRIRGRKVRVSYSEKGSFGANKEAGSSRLSDEQEIPSAIERGEEEVPKPRASASRKSFGEKKPYDQKREFGDKKPFQKREFGDRKPFGEKREFGDRKSFGEKREFGERKPFGEKREFGERKSFGEKREFGERKSFGEKREFGEKKSFGDKKPFAKRDFGSKPSDGSSRRFGAPKPGDRFKPRGRMEPKKS
ncbi:MAG: DEAD/DEAH box helicase [Archangium sp.]